MASLILRRVFQRSFSQTSFQHAIQRQIIQEDGKFAFIEQKRKRFFCRTVIIEENRNK